MTFAGAAESEADSVAGELGRLQIMDASELGLDKETLTVMNIDAKVTQALDDAGIGRNLGPDGEDLLQEQEGLASDSEGDDGAGQGFAPGISKAMRLWLPPALGGVGVPLQQKRPSGGKAPQKRQAPSVAHTATAAAQSSAAGGTSTAVSNSTQAAQPAAAAAAAPSAFTSQASAAAAAAQNPDVDMAAASSIHAPQHDTTAQPAASSGPQQPQVHRKFTPTPQVPKRKVIMLDTLPPDSPTTTLRHTQAPAPISGANHAAANGAALPAQSTAPSRAAASAGPTIGDSAPTAGPASQSDAVGSSIADLQQPAGQQQSPDADVMKLNRRDQKDYSWMMDDLDRRMKDEVGSEAGEAGSDGSSRDDSFSQLDEFSDDSASSSQVRKRVGVACISTYRMLKSGALVQNEQKLQHTQACRFLFSYSPSTAMKPD